jgi:hypothetical protein
LAVANKNLGGFFVMIEADPFLDQIVFFGTPTKRATYGSPISIRNDVC